MSSQEAPDAYARALALANREEFPAALLEIQQALAEHDERHNVHNLAGYILLSLQVPQLIEASLNMFERSLELWPDHTVALENLVNALVKLGQTEVAMARLTEEAKGRRRIAATRSHARLLVRLGKLEEALPLLEAAARDNFEMHVELGEVCVALGQLKEATEAFAAAIRSNRGGIKPHRLLAETCVKLTWYRSALAAASRGLEVAKSDDVESHAALTAAKDAATAALLLANVQVPEHLDSLAFEVACEDEVPLAWAFRHDDPDIQAARQAFLAGLHEDAIAKTRAALRVPNRHPTVILAFAYWAGRRADVSGAISQAIDWKVVELECAEDWLLWSDGAGEAASTRVHIAAMEQQLASLRARALVHPSSGG